MSDLAFARALHVLAVILWIGGVAMVTTVLLPATRRLKTPTERVDFFNAIEHRFALQARITTVVTGVSGLYLVYGLGLWHRFALVEYWWMHAMVLVWALFSLMLFVVEPFLLHRWFSERATRDPDSTFTLIVRLHWVLLALSLVTVAGAVAGSHGYLLFRS